MKTFEEQVREKCDEIAELLIEKNRKYGNAVLDPIRVFSKLPPREQLWVRLDDKLSRIKNRQNDDDEDPVKDTIGYLILELIDRGNETISPRQATRSKVWWDPFGLFRHR